MIRQVESAVSIQSYISLASLAVYPTHRRTHWPYEITHTHTHICWPMAIIALDHTAFARYRVPTGHSSLRIVKHCRQSWQACASLPRPRSNMSHEQATKQSVRYTARSRERRRVSTEWQQHYDDVRLSGRDATRRPSLPSMTRCRTASRCALHPSR